jgi:hypothetical protein
VQQLTVHSVDISHNLIDLQHDEIKYDEMGGPCGMYGERKEMHTEFWWLNHHETCLGNET